tara:strand:+ start:49 stop:1047 length:999 start_codon:yes stop_codon:yes gene_type:complete
MKAPEFWSNDNSILPTILTPIGGIYDACARARTAFSTANKAPLPVICVGNVVVGGAGKTPCTMALLTRLRAAGVDSHAISRGYGGRVTGPVRVDPATHRARDVGDEPLLLATVAPTWVASDRFAATRQAAEAGARLVVLDDGLQNPTLEKDLSLLVIDPTNGVGNGRILPAGPLREPLARALDRVQAVIVLDGAATGQDGGWPQTIDRLHPGLPVFRARLTPEMEAVRLLEQPVIAFAGLGRPEKFFSLLHGMGCDLAGTYAFADHHRYSPDEIMKIVEEATSKGARPVTTAKDAVRLPVEAAGMVDVIHVVVEFEDEAGIDALLHPFLKSS